MKMPEETEKLVWRRFYEKHSNLQGIAPWKRVEVRINGGVTYICFYEITDKEFEDYTFIFTCNPSHYEILSQWLGKHFPNEDLAETAQLESVNGKDASDGFVLVLPIKAHPGLLLAAIPEKGKGH